MQLGVEVGVVIVIVCVAVFCILAAGIGLVKLWRLHADAAVNFLNLNKQKGRTKAGPKNWRSHTILQFCQS